ncbi:MAG: hypothetical protein KZQ90_15190 [Candidatus Thiodiazotropha sp. (ex Codakia rugifera)]|nr:hypothetical protein [Candidatus Thiodiazotropha sp. (ex Codakia rugifera)]
MDLSLGRLSGFSNNASASGGIQRGVESSRAELITAGSSTEDSAAIPATRESTTQRPVMETGQANPLTPEEQAQVRELQKVDREVRAHEAAHRAAAGGLASGGSYTYQTGPDGRNYAVGGEVSISASSTGTPREKLQQAETIRRAALAPADPSSQDRQVAAQAAATAAQARIEISAAKHQEQTEQRKETAGQENRQNTQQVSNLSTLGRRAIASFEGVAGNSAMQSNPTSVDEII